jgi:hypothetical protein
MWLLLAGLFLRPLRRADARAFVSLAAAAIAYAAIALGDWGHAWPQLDSPASALTHPLPWFASLPLLLSVLLFSRAKTDTLGSLLPLALLCTAALARPGHDPAALSQLRGSLDISPDSSKILLFHATQGLILSASMWIAGVVGERLVRANEALADKLAWVGRALLVIWALIFLSGIHGALCRQWLLRWPLWLSGDVLLFSSTE